MIWTNVLSVIGGLGAYITTGDTSTLAVSVLGVVNTILRCVTSQPLE